MAELFDKPLNDLREAFVRARFAEPAMFGRADILEWLADPEWTGIIDFDKSRAFVRHFEGVWESLEHDQELARYATPTNKIPDWMLRRVSSKAVYAVIVKALMAGKAKIYYPWMNDVNRNPVAVLHGWVFNLAHTTIDGSIVALKTATVRDVLEIFNAEIKGCRPNADKARAFLNRTARHAVADARKAAVNDFDEAVAVSADGTRIVKADWVVVGVREHRDKNRATLYPAEAFRNEKALLPKRGHERFNFGTSSPKPESDDVDGLVKAISARNDVYGGRGMLDLHGTPYGNVLFVHETLCPTPLPEGGRVIRA